MSPLSPSVTRRNVAPCHGDGGVGAEGSGKGRPPG